MGADQSRRAKSAGLTLVAGQAAQQAPGQSGDEAKSAASSPAHTPPSEEKKSVESPTAAGAVPGGDDLGAPPDRGAASERKAKLEDFELMAVLGRGQWGKVMMVRKRDSGHVYAMKVIRKEYMIARNQTANIKSERLLLELVKCPFVVHLHFAFQTEDKLYLILDYINGGELFFHLKREGRFSEDRVRFYCAEMVLALEQLHDLDILYRDLKPENVLLDSAGHIRLVDFGLSKQFNSPDARTYTFCGTPEYLAPEVLLAEGYTNAIDWWCLGSLMYEMMIGLPPFYSEDIEEMYRRILSQTPVRFERETSPEAQDLVRGLLAFRAEDRLGSKEAGGVAAIKAHPYFRGIDWAALNRMEVTPPFKPVVRSEVDTDNFDHEFTAEAPMDSMVERELEYTVVFDSFSYVNSALR